MQLFLLLLLFFFIIKKNVLLLFSFEMLFLDKFCNLIREKCHERIRLSNLECSTIRNTTFIFLKAELL